MMKNNKLFLIYLLFSFIMENIKKIFGVDIEKF